jgi:ComF family protein
MPLHTLRYAERGYNQSEMLAKGLSKVLGVPMSAKILKRIKNTPSQTGLNAVERQKNVSGAFRVVKPGVIIAKTVLLVDDVKTTGATMNECARVLMQQMPTKIHAISLAVAN